MEAHAHVVASSGGDVLNVGFGLGLIDEVRSGFYDHPVHAQEGSCHKTLTRPGACLLPTPVSAVSHSLVAAG